MQPRPSNLFPPCPHRPDSGPEAQATLPIGVRRLGWRRRISIVVPAALLAAFAIGWTATTVRSQEDAGDSPRPPDSAADEAADVATEARAWGAIVYAGPETIKGLEDGDDVAGAEMFDRVRTKLAKVFPAERHVLLAEHTQKIFKEYESWVVPSKELFLKIDSRGPAPDGGTKLGVQVWQGEKVLAKADAVLTPDKPLFIAGPKWRGGRLIFVVVLL